MRAPQAEVFALNNLLNALLLLLLVRYDAARTLTAACLGAFAIGLALTNQHTMIFFCAPYATWAMWTGRRELARPVSLCALCVAGLVGLAPYAYLVARGGPSAPWGSWGNQRTLGGLITHVLRAEYGAMRPRVHAPRVHVSTCLTYMPQVNYIFNLHLLTYIS